MQDYSLWMRHEDGGTKRLGFIDSRMDKLDDIFPSSCLACFDYPNSLADITIGYTVAPLGWQWILLRTERGEAPFDLLASIRPLRITHRPGPCPPQPRALRWGVRARLRGAAVPGRA